MINRTIFISIVFVILFFLWGVNCETVSKSDDYDITPYMALLSSRNGESTGVIIHPEWILSSAYGLVDKEGIPLHDAEIEVGAAARLTSTVIFY